MRTWKRLTFFKEVNEVVFGLHPGATVVAEESTAWPSVSYGCGVYGQTNSSDATAAAVLGYSTGIGAGVRTPATLTASIGEV